jgi:hypothetical protein
MYIEEYAPLGMVARRKCAEGKRGPPHAIRAGRVLH